MTIKYLTVQEKETSRFLWEEAFPEDSEPFKNYYFSENIKDNRILVLEEEDEVDAMLHQNPYRIHVGERLWQSDYIVGVATRESRRHRGYMRQLLNHMMQQMWEEQMPFCFLMPADEAIYHPFGFSYIFNQPQWKLIPNDSIQRREIKGGVTPGNRRYLSEIASWMEHWLKDSYEVYTQRDEAYLQRLIRELESEAGGLEALYDAGQLVGLYGRWGLKEKEQRLLYCRSGYALETIPAKPAIMARIICGAQFVKAIRLRGEVIPEAIQLAVKIEDPIVAGNHGSFCWHLNHETSWLEPWQGDAAEDTLELTIDQLTQWLFGYAVPEAAKPYETVIQVLEGVFLDEIV